MNQANALYHLQSLDLDIKAGQARLGEVKATLGTDRPIQKAEAQLAKAKAELTPWQTRAADLELEIESLATKAKQSEKRLYSGKVSNPKELQDLQQEIASLKRRRSQLEDNLLESMMQVESHEATYEKALRKLERIKVKWAAKQEELAHERDELEARLEALAGDRALAWDGLEAESRTMYTQLKKKLGDEPVAALVDGASCSRCGMRQNSSVAQQARHGIGLPLCGGCGRVLVVPQEG